MTPTPGDVTRGRVCLIFAALLWSLGGLFTRLLQRDTPLGLNEPALEPLQIAFYRALFAGLVFLPALRWREIRFRRLMPVMVLLFAAMNALFLSAMALGSAANAILLQNTAPFWVYLIGVCFLGQRPDRRSVIALLAGMAGIAIIIVGGWRGEPDATGMSVVAGGLTSGASDGGSRQFAILAMAIGSGITYAGVILCLGSLRKESSQWLTMQNHLGSAFCLGIAVMVLMGPLYWWNWVAAPTARQIVFLAFFGSIQMALPYYLFARGLRSVSPQEASILTLLEPILNPLWAYLISPETDTPPPATWIGGAMILAALAWRYWPRSARTAIVVER